MPVGGNNLTLASCELGKACFVNLTNVAAPTTSRLRIFPPTVACGISWAQDADYSDWRYANKNDAMGGYVFDLMNITSALPIGDYRLCMCNSSCSDNSVRSAFSITVGYLQVLAQPFSAGAVGTQARPGISCSHIKAVNPSEYSPMNSTKACIHTLKC